LDNVGNRHRESEGGFFGHPSVAAASDQAREQLHERLESARDERALRRRRVRLAAEARRSLVN